MADEAVGVGETNIGYNNFLDSLYFSDIRLVFASLDGIIFYFCLSRGSGPRKWIEKK